MVAKKRANTYGYYERLGAPIYAPNFGYEWAHGKSITASFDVSASLKPKAAASLIDGKLGVGVKLENEKFTFESIHSVPNPKYPYVAPYGRSSSLNWDVKVRERVICQHGVVYSDQVVAGWVRVPSKKAYDKYRLKIGYATSDAALAKTIKSKDDPIFKAGAEAVGK